LPGSIEIVQPTPQTRLLLSKGVAVSTVDVLDARTFLF
jgi:hypothetical protein